MSIFSSIAKIGKGVLDVVAPTLASALPGPLGGLAKKAVTDLLGIDAKSSNEAIEEALAAADPETLLALRKLDAEFKQNMAQLGVDVERIHAGDRASAREREIALKDWAPKVLAFIIVGGWVAAQYYLFTQVLPIDNRDIILRSMGIMEGALLAVLYYYFGSSAGSRAKDSK